MRGGIVLFGLLFAGIFGVGVLSNSLVVAQSDAFLDFSTSKSVYTTNSEFITISGKVSGELYRDRSSAIIEIIYPNGDVEEYTAYVLENRIFSKQVRTNSEMQLGVYTLQAHYMNKDSQKITVELVRDVTTSTQLKPEIRDAPKATAVIPDWIKTIVDWWKQGLLTDKELGQSLAHLVKVELIHVEGADINSQEVGIVNSNVSIPKWIEDDIRMWADNKISDSEFASRIDSLIKLGLISYVKLAPDRVDTDVKVKGFLDEKNEEHIEKLTAEGSKKTIDYDQKIEDKIIVASNDPKKLTLLVYMVGSDLEHDIRNDVVSDYFATKNIDEMIDAVPSEDINVVLATGGSKQAKKDDTRKIDFSTVSISTIESGTGALVTKPYATRSMSSPELLSDFLTWSMKTYPAEKYVLILWDHGYGARGYSHDNTAGSGDILSINELKTALAKTYKDTDGKKFELIGFDACYMATYEVANKVSDYANYMVASQELEPGTGWDYSAIIKKLNEPSELNGSDLGKTIAKSYYDKNVRNDRIDGKNSASTSTISVINLLEFKSKVVKAFDNFESSLLTLSTDYYYLLSVALDGTERFGKSSKTESAHVDLKGFAELVKNIPRITQTASALSSAIDTAVPIELMKNGNAKNAYGLSLYFPSLDSSQSEGFTKNAQSKYRGGQSSSGQEPPENLLKFAEFKIVDKYFKYLETEKQDNRLTDFQVTQSSPGTFVVTWADNVHIQSLTFYFTDEIDSEYVEIFSNREFKPNSESKKSTFTWNGFEPALCNSDSKPICYPINPTWEFGSQNKFVYLPVLVYPSVNELEPYNAIDGDLIYDITNINDIIFVGFTPVGSEGVSKQLSGLADDNMVQILSYQVDRSGDVFYEPVEMLSAEGLKFTWKVFKWGPLNVKVELCDFSGNCILKEDSSLTVNSKDVVPAEWENGIELVQDDPLEKYFVFEGEYDLDDSYEWEEYDPEYEIISMNDYCVQLHSEFDNYYGFQEVQFICEDIEYDFGPEIDTYTAQQIIADIWYDINNPIEYVVEEDVLTIDELCSELHVEFDNVMGYNEVENACMQIGNQYGYYISFAIADEIWDEFVAKSMPDNVITIDEFYNMLQINFDYELGENEVDNLFETYYNEFGDYIDLLTAQQIIDDIWVGIYNESDPGLPSDCWVNNNGTLTCWVDGAEFICNEDGQDCKPVEKSYSDIFIECYDNGDGSETCYDEYGDVFYCPDGSSDYMSCEYVSDTISMNDYCVQLHSEFDNYYGFQEVQFICEDIEYDFGPEIDTYTAQQIIDDIWSYVDSISDDPPSDPSNTLPMTQTVSIPYNTSVPGCEINYECYLPSVVTVGIGGMVTWSNDDTAAHTVTSGTPGSGNIGEFDSGLFMAGTTWSHTFDYTGSYDYFCMVHPWMTGIVNVGYYDDTSTPYKSTTQPPTGNSVDNPTNVPDWVINNSEWFSDSLIPDSEFINTAQFLINNGYIPGTSGVDLDDSVVIPDWIKNNAGWWASGEISWDEFVQTIEYLASLSSTSPEPEPETISMTDLCNDLHFDFDSLIGWQNTENICDYVEDTVGSEMDVDSIESLYDAIWADIDAGNYDEPSNTLPMTQTISLAQGSGVPGCETNNACYLPYSVTVGIGATVTWSNDDTAAHTVTSGSAANGATGEFDSAFIMAGTTWSHTFDYGGVYDYYCMVHPWMQGTVYVGPTY